METNLLVAGFGGQGVMILGKLLSHAVCDHSQKNVTFFPSYGAEQRGGTANCYVVISDAPIGVPIGDVMDDMIVMNEPSLNKFLGLLKKGGLLFINSSIVKADVFRTDVRLVKAPVTELALSMGNPKVQNILMLGVYVGCTGIIEDDLVESAIVQELGKKASLIALNRAAFQKGLAIGKEQRPNGHV
jgi:2-oxoglutarate ferredoxin oxidoreductase subunit gamma